MNVMRLFFAGVLVMSMHLGAQELEEQPGSTETEVSSDIPEAPPLDGKLDAFALQQDASELSMAPSQVEQEVTPTSQPEVQALPPLSPQSRFHLPPPPRFLKPELIEKIKTDFNSIENERIPALKDPKRTYRSSERFADQGIVASHKKLLNTYESCAERDSLIAKADQLTAQLTNIGTQRNVEILSKLQSKIEAADQELGSGEQGSFNPEDSQEPEDGQATVHAKSYITPRFKQTFALLLGGVAMSIAAIIYYFKWYKPAAAAR